MKDTAQKNEGMALAAGAEALSEAEAKAVAPVLEEVPEVVLDRAGVEAGALAGVDERTEDEADVGRATEHDTAAIGIIDLTPTVVTYIRITHSRTIISSRTMNRFLLCWKPQPKR